MEMKTLVLAVTLVLATSIGNNKASPLAEKKPLHLTPLMDSGEITKARDLSLVIDNFIPRSYAGLITVDKELGNHLFFWFFPAVNSDPQSPLVVWSNGPSGISSLFGLLYENGPLRIQNRKDNKIVMEQMNESWTQNLNMLYVDPILGIGYSYTDKEHNYRFTHDRYSKDLYTFMNQFYSLFPEYTTRELYIGGEDYAGKFVPSFAHYLHTEIRAKRSSIPLKGIYLGAPLFDAKTQFREGAKLYAALGVMSPKEAAEFETEFDEFVKLGHYKNMTTHDLFNKLAPSVGLNNRGKGNYLTLVKPKYTQIEYFMNRDNVRDAFHMGNLTYNVFSFAVYTSIGQDILVSTAFKLATLMDNYKVLIYNGDLDGIINSAMIEAGLQSMNKWKSRTTYTDSKRIVWGPEDNPKGFYTQTGQFCRVVIRCAGSEAPRSQPEVSRDMMEQFVKFGCIQQTGFNQSMILSA